MMRFAYYNSVDPDYKPDAGGALLASFRAVVGEPVNMYLRANIDNFIDILKASVAWYSKNDYKFYSREKNLQKFDDQTKRMQDLIEDLEKEKIKYVKEWNDERAKSEKEFDSELIQVNQVLSGKAKPDN